MRRVFPLLLTLVLVLLAALLFARFFAPAPRFDAAASAAAARALDQAEALAPLDLLLAGLWRLVPLAAVVGALVIAGRYFWLRARLVHLDGAPIDLARLDDVTPVVLASYGRARVLAASQPNVPHSINSSTHYAPTTAPHYAPSWSTRSDTRSTSTLPELVAENAAPTLVPPTFAELLNNGTIAAGQPLVLGWGEQGAVTGSWRALLSTGLGGLQGSGKTTTAAALLSQAALSGGKLLVVDPHAGEDDSLATRIAPLAPAYLAEVASDGRAIIALLRQARAELERRRRGSGERWPLIVCVDEWTALLRGELAEQLPPFIAELTSEGRKYNAYAFLLAQRWASGDVGGGGVRNTLAAAYVHRMRADEARYLTGLRAAQLPADILQLASGESYLLDTSGQLTKVRTPQITPRDVQRVAGMLTDTAPTTPRGTATIQPLISQEEAAGATASGRAALAPEQARIVDLFLGGLDAGAIVTELTGMKSKGGTPYLNKLAEVQATIRQALASR